MDNPIEPIDACTDLIASPAEGGFYFRQYSTEGILISVTYPTRAEALESVEDIEWEMWEDFEDAQQKSDFEVWTCIPILAMASPKPQEKVRFTSTVLVQMNMGRR